MVCRLFPGKPLSRTNAGLLSIGPLSNKLQWNLNQNTKLLTHKNAFENIVCEIAAIFSKGRWEKYWRGIAILFAMFATATNPIATYTIQWRCPSVMTSQVTCMSIVWLKHLQVYTSRNKYDMSFTAEPIPSIKTANSFLYLADENYLELRYWYYRCSWCWSETDNNITVTLKWAR